MSDVFTFHEGETPLLVSVPHDGRELPESIASRMTEAGCALPDTDWHVAELYDFCRELGASMLVARFSRYVVDLNRPADDSALYPGQLATGICPTETFAGQPLYLDSEGVTPSERAERVERYWLPYHRQIATTLNDLIARHGYALLWDAHSIQSTVPRLFDGELAVLNLGTDDGRSCPQVVTNAVAAVAKSSRHSSVVNGRFRGGYITRHYGNRARDCFAMQLELAQRAYMDEETLVYDRALAEATAVTLRRMLEAYLTTAREEVGR